MAADRRHSRDTVGVHTVYEDLEDEILKVQRQGQRAEQEQFHDDIAGQPLDPALVREARRRELEYFESKGVWKLQRYEEARRLTGRRPISVRWVDVNKGDDKSPNIRSRLVAREIRAPGTESVLQPHH